MSSNDNSTLPDLESLTPQQREEAFRAAMAAKRAEERAERKAMERAQAQKRLRDTLAVSAGQSNGKVKFLTKNQREELVKKRAAESNGGTGRISFSGSGAGAVVMAKGRSGKLAENNKKSITKSGEERREVQHHLSQAQVTAIKRSYLGDAVGNREKERKQRKKKTKKMMFKFEWDKEDDTLGNANDDLLYSDAILASRSNGKGKDKKDKRDALFNMKDVWSKPLEEMTPRDWRIVRENYDIRVKGGRAPPPMRSFRETPIGVPSIHPSIIDAVENIMRFKDPSPIQRQSIPIGLQRRDLIGIAETGSGKTAAFGIPLCHLILSLPVEAVHSVANDGPLALVMAPTRELALQIDVEITKLLSRQKKIKTLAVVGGQPIQQQAYKLREGVHIVVGTPGRINDCIEMSYLVLNQCSYIVLDEADRMIDLGFAPQIDQILESMGLLLKSEDETEAYKEEQDDMERLGKAIPRRRLTAMFSATMPPEVERIAKKYLRHPAIVAIGDEESGKNARITQRVMFLSSPAQKERTLQDLLRRSAPGEKIIVFVNEKKHADGIGRMVERAGRRCVVLHGGKSQDQREENLDIFKRGGVVLVATDVAGRGLDVPDVTQIINYDLPTRSIDNYCHRIGRTGRAGKEGIATSFMTDSDEGIMAALKKYLEITGMPVPDRLARHPAAGRGRFGGESIIH